VEPPEPGGWGLPLVAWLLLGFALVIAAFVVGSLLAQRGTRLATAELDRVQREVEPLARTARELGESAAGFDRAVLDFLGTDSERNRTQLTAAGERLARALNATPDSTGTASADGAALLTDLAAHKALGFQLAELREARGKALDRLDTAYAGLGRRLDSGGSSGIRVGESVLTRPEMQALATALSAARVDAERAVASFGSTILPATPGETRFRETLRAHDEALARSPGRAWLSLVEEDFATGLRQRRAAQVLRAEIEAARSRFTAEGGPLAERIRELYEAPAWDRFEAAAQGAAASLRRAERDITDATMKSILAALLVMVLMAVLVTRPIRRLTAGARRLAAGDLRARVIRGGASEVDELSRTFNQMAEKLDAAEREVRSYQAQLEHRVTERTQQLQHLAEHDPLTDLPNRRQLFRHLSERIAAANLGGERLAVLFLDLDNFKTVNDSLGHEFGDRVLTEIGGRLRLLGGESGFIARLGGDEFTLVFPFSGSVGEIEERAANLVARFQKPLEVDHREIAIGVSCGAAIFPDHGTDPVSLLRAADAALFRAKELGRNRLCLYDPELLVAASNRFRLEQALRRAIDTGGFVMHYQPQVSVSRQLVTGAEALLRWRREDGVIVAAGDFIEIAEQSGLMLELNGWILDQAAADVRRWRDAGWSDARVAINVSAQQFVSGDFLADTERLLERHGLPPEALEFELTENMLQTGAVTVHALRALRDLGIATTLDDFGTGYSSLTSLEQLPLTRVKLDRSVLAEVDTNPRAASIGSSMISLCRSLGLQVTVEGVERAGQLGFLAGCGEVCVQGFLVARPMPADELLEVAEAMHARMGALLEAAAANARVRTGPAGLRRSLDR
jgi:diguanylate cyclase (GGDEF)-like protein